MLRGLFTHAILIAAVAATPSATAQSAGRAVPDISGSWKLNVEASTNPNGPQAKPLRAGGGEGDESGGRGTIAGAGQGATAGGAGLANSGGPTSAQLGREEMQRFNVMLQSYRVAPQTMDIKATAGAVTLAYNPPKGPVFTHTTDNKKQPLNTRVTKVSIKAKWEGATLRRESETEETLKVVEDFTLSPDGRQLIVTVKTTSRMVRLPDAEAKAPIRRVYDRVQ